VDKYYWSFDNKCDTWRDNCNTIEECIKEARIEVREDKLLSNAVFIGEGYNYKPSIFAEGLLENICEQAYSDCGEVAECWLEYISMDQVNKLGDELNEVFHKWLKDIGEMPTFGTVENIKLYSLATGEIVEIGR